MELIKNISEFVKGMLPVFKKDRVLEDIRITIGEYNLLKPRYAEAATLFNHYTPKDETVIKYSKVFKANFTGKFNSNIICHVDENMDLLISNLKAVEGLANYNLDPNIATAGLSIRQAVVIRYTECFSFLSKYLRKYLTFVYVAETIASGSEGVLSDSVSKADQKWLEDNLDSFINAYKVCLRDSDKSKESIEQIPEINVAQSNYNQLQQTVGEDKIDPLEMRFVTTGFSPIYFVRAKIAEYQVARYQEMKKEVETLGLRKMHLENQIKNRPNPRLQAQIEVLESMIHELNAKTAEFEEGLKYD